MHGLLAFTCVSEMTVMTEEKIALLERTRRDRTVNRVDWHSDWFGREI